MKVRLLLVPLLITALGCGLLEFASPTRESVPATLPDPSATPSPVPPTATATPSPSPTPDACPAAQERQPPALTDDLENNIAAIQTYLDQGGDPQQITVDELGKLLRGDVTGDGSPETVMVLVDPLSEQIPPKGHLIVFACSGGGVVQLYRYAPADWYGLDLIALADLTDDDVSDVIFSDVSCGAHTCWHTPYDWSWEGDDFVNYVESGLQFPYPDYTVEEGELIVVSGGIGSVGAGPQRPVTTTLAWTGEVLAVAAETTAAPTYRYHAFVDGDQAFREGDLAQAAALYQRVLEDETLTAWGAAYEPEAEHDALRALGEWRLLILSASQGDTAAAEPHYTTLMASSQSSAVRGAVARLAERFWRSYQRDGELAAACAYAVDSDAAQTVADFLNGFGYANPVFEQQDLCPYLRS